MRKLWLVVVIALAFKGWGWVRSEMREPILVTDANVELYATDWCGYCAKTRELFEKNGIEYVEFDIEKDAEAHARFKAMGGNGVPLTVINKDVIYGYSEREFEKQLGI